MSETSINHPPPGELELVPLHFFLMEGSPLPPVQVREAASDTYHSEAYVCEVFYKQISRCVGELSNNTNYE